MINSVKFPIILPFNVDSTLPNEPVEVDEPLMSPNAVMSFTAEIFVALSPTIFPFAVISPLAFIAPATSNLTVGLSCPIATLLLLCITIP